MCTPLFARAAVDEMAQSANPLMSLLTSRMRRPGPQPSDLDALLPPTGRQFRADAQKHRKSAFWSEAGRVSSTQAVRVLREERNVRRGAAAALSFEAGE